MSRRQCTVASTIGDHHDAIIESWRAAVATSVSARGLTRPECLNLMPVYLKSLADVTQGQLGSESASRLAIVEDHLGSRLRHGFELSEIVEEFALLGRSVSQLWASLPLDQRPDPVDVEHFYTELHNASACAARIFEEHMRDEEQCAKRFTHRLESVAVRAASGTGNFDLTPVLGVILEATGAAAAAVFVENDLASAIKVSTACATPAQATAIDGLARDVDLHDDNGQPPDPIRSRQLGPTAASLAAGLGRVLVTRFPAGERRRAAILVASKETRPYSHREVRRLEALAERLALHIESTQLHAELRRTIAELRSEKQMREAFVAVLAHDLRGPLSTAQLQATVLGQRADSVEEVRAGASRIDRVLGRADRMIRDLLDANRIRAGEPITLDIGMFDLRAVVRDTVDELAIAYPGRIILDAHGPVEGFWSPDQLRRAVWNLIVNALKYGAPDRPVTVSVGCRADAAIVVVHNEGRAIPADRQSSIFDAFSQIAGEGPPSRRGWGLGLTLVRGAAEAHGGHVRCQSDAEHGTTFTIELPVDARPFQRDSLLPVPARAVDEARSLH